MTRFDDTRFDAASFAPIALATRNGFDESLHVGAGVALDANGAVDAGIGDHDLVVYPRSCLKPLQADAMIAAGLDIAADQLALACASHSGEPHQLEIVCSLLSRVGLDEHALRNTAARPYGAAARAALREASVAPSPLQQNCSGKHAAMLATCRLNGWSIEDYLDVDHPLQRAITAHIETLAGESVSHVGVDGCGAPTHAFSLRGLAKAIASLTLPGRDPRIADAMRAHPELVGGTGRDVSAWMRSVPGLIAKEGAAGVMVAALQDGRSVAYKIADGSDAARQAVMPEALRLIGVDEDVIAATAHDTAIPVLGAGVPVGRLVALDWPERS